MILYSYALKIIRETALQYSVSAVTTSEPIALDQTLGRILAEPIFSPEEVPSFTNSAMDGFALFSADTLLASASNPVKIQINGLVAAGDLQAYEQGRFQESGKGIEIMTGAPIPEAGLHGEYNAVARIEDVCVERNSSGNATAIEITRPLKAGDNIRLKGTDFKIGDSVLNAGTRIQPAHILACASLGISHIKVKTKPRIAIVSTGSELVSSGEKNLPPGMIRNSTGPFLKAALSTLDVEVNDLGIVCDDPEIYRATLERAITQGAEIIISTGAVSMGKYDFVSDVLEQMGAKIHFHKAAIRPGKPILFAEIEFGNKKCVFFGMPGNPVSTAVALRFFVDPYLRTRQGLPQEYAIPAILALDCKKPEELRCFFKGHALFTKNGLSVEALKGQASYVVSALLDANCWVVFSEGRSEVLAQTHVDIFPIQSSFENNITYEKGVRS